MDNGKGCGGGPGTDLEGLWQYERSGMSLGANEKDLRLVYGPKVGVKSQNILCGPKDGYGGPDMDVKGFGGVWRTQDWCKGLWVCVEGLR